MHVLVILTDITITVNPSVRLLQLERKFLAEWISRYISLTLPHLFERAGRIRGKKGQSHRFHLDDADDDITIGSRSDLVT
jgi:vacuolar-type H+-ATPase subunit B/Vma2